MVAVVTPVMTCIISVSLLSGKFSENLKDALIKPLLKEIGLELIFKSLCPVSNLSYVSKLVERFTADQLVDHVTQNGLTEKFQSAYRASHSTETALTHVKNDILLHMDRKKVCAWYYLICQHHLTCLTMQHCWNACKVGSKSQVQCWNGLNPICQTDLKLLC